MSEPGGVAVLGLGQMGSALALALVDGGHRVTVWNRSSERAAPLLKKGATLALSPAAAIAGSRLIVMCVFDYSAANAILGSPGVAQAFSHKTLVQLSSGALNEVLDQKQWVEKQSGHFIAGGILAFPRNIGRPNTLIVYSGDAEAFEQYRCTLASLAGSSHYLGADPGLAIGAYFTLGTLIMGVQSLFFETAALARQYGVSMNSYYPLVRLVTDHVAETIRDGAHRILTGQFDDSQASISLWLAYMQDVAGTFDRTGIPAKMTEAIVGQLKLGMTRGDGNQDVARLTESLWACRNSGS